MEVKPNMNNQLSIKGILFDLDGVLYTGDSPIEGAVDTITAIRASGIPCRFVTNASTLSLATLLKKINALGFDIPANELISAPQATLLYLRKQNHPVCRLLLAEDVKQDFNELPQSETNPDYIVIGDIGNAWTYALLNDVFNALMNGAKLITIHKNKFWQTEQGLKMDIGVFVTALEYASGVNAMVIGKPSSDFFRIALDDMGLMPCEVMMVGDDIDVDVSGGQQVGLKGVLVKTGKYRQSYADASTIKPDFTIDSIANLLGVIGF
jgi:HAD superfamily hydrolase (TIGR01458 family)